MVSELRIFKRVFTRLVTREGELEDRVRDVPSAFLVHVASLTPEKISEYSKQLDTEGNPEEEVSSLNAYVISLISSGRFLNKVRKKKRARKI